MAAVTAPGDAGQTWYRWRARWLASRWHPTRLLSTWFRRRTAIVVLVVFPAAVRWVTDATIDGPWWWLGAVTLVVWLWWMGTIGDTWDRQVRAAEKAPRTPPEPLNSAVLYESADIAEYEPRIIAGWDQVSAEIIQNGRNLGLDVDDPYTLAVLVAGITMPVQYAQTHPVTVETATYLYGGAYKLRAIDVARRAGQDVDAP